MSTGPRWNFEKFLLDHRGQPVRRYDESLDPSEIVPDIETLLDNLAGDTNIEAHYETLSSYIHISHLFIFTVLLYHTSHGFVVSWLMNRLEEAFDFNL